MGKHSKIEKNEKSQKNHKSFLIIIFILVIVFIIVAGVFIKNSSQNEELEDLADIDTVIKETIDNAFSALKYLDVDEANKYLDYESLVNKLDEMILEGREDDSVSDLEEKLFASLEWNINDIQEINDSTVEVSIEFTNKNFNIIVIEWIDLLRELEDDDITDEVKLEKFEDAVDSIKETKTIEKTVLLVKENDSWTIKVNTDLRDAIFTGMDSIAEAAKKSQ